MTIIEKIKAEIERLKGQLIRGSCATQIEMGTSCKEEAYDEVLSFLSTLESESGSSEIPNDLEEAADEHVNNIAYCGDDIELEKEQSKRDFIAGAKWDRSQMMKEAVEGTVHNFSSYKPHPTVLVDARGFNQGDKVRVIVLPKEN